MTYSFTVLYVKTLEIFQIVSKFLITFKGVNRVGRASERALLFSLTLALLICGCSRHDVELEARVQKLEEGRARDAATEKEVLTNMLQDIYELQKGQVITTNMVGLYSEVTESELTAHDQAISNLSNSIIILESRLPGAAHRAVTQAPPASGIPRAVYDQIVQDAQREWPTDYTMQQYRIKEQVEAWLKLHQ